jgi:hypothetical protein
MSGDQARPVDPLTCNPATVEGQYPILHQFT